MIFINGLLDFELEKIRIPALRQKPDLNLEK